MRKARLSQKQIITDMKSIEAGRTFNTNTFLMGIICDCFCRIIDRNKDW